MNLLKRKLNDWFGWFKPDNRVKPSDIIDPSTIKVIKELDMLLPRVIENLKKLKDELQAS